MKSSFLLVCVVFGVHSKPLPDGVKDSGCGEIFTEDEFTITSDNYPGHYPPNENCFYLLKGGNCTSRFKFEFIYFDIQNSVGCTSERLEIGNQDALCGSKNGTKIYLAENGNLKLKFISQPATVPAGSGFKILVRRLGCEIEEVSTTTTALTPVEATRCCDDNNFSSKRFFLVSPNFPRSIDTDQDCSYVIRKNNGNVCRLRIHALFFWLGEPSYNSCPRGYLEIDGKYICGCNADIKLTSNFGFSDRKILNFRVFGSQISAYSGFVLEVFQDECPKRYSPKGESISEEYYESRWPDIEQLQLVHEKSDSISPDTNNTHQGLGNILRHLYVFAPKQDSDAWLNMEPKTSSYIDTFSINTLLSDVFNYRKCVEWNREQLINDKIGGNFIGVCKGSNEMSSYAGNCVVLNSLAGKIINVPPFWGRQNSCYRFQTRPGYCEVKLTFNEFDMPESNNNYCGHGYLSFGDKFRYCGNHLKDTTAILNIQKRPNQEMRFVSNLFCCRRGFSAIYRQIPCQDPYYPITPANPPWNSNGDHTPKSVPNKCERIIQKETFILSGYDISDSCTYIIKRISDDVCKLVLHFDYFDIKCTEEKIVVDGISYCGRLTGRQVQHNFTSDQLIVYQKYQLASLESNGPHFRISGIQISNNCEPDLPPPQRIKAVDNLLQENNNQEFNYTNNILNGICQVIENTEGDENYPHNLCLILKNLYPEIKCEYFDVAGNSSLSDANSRQLKIKLDNGNSLEIRKLHC